MSRRAEAWGEIKARPSDHDLIEMTSRLDDGYLDIAHSEQDAATVRMPQVTPSKGKLLWRKLAKQGARLAEIAILGSK